MTATRPTTCTLTVAADGSTCGKPAVAVHTFKLSDGYYAECAEHETHVETPAPVEVGEKVSYRAHGVDHVATVLAVRPATVDLEFVTLGGRTKFRTVGHGQITRR